MTTESSWAYLYRDHADRMRRVLRARLRPRCVSDPRASSVISTEDVDDVVHDAFLRAMESAGFARLDGDRVPYLFTIARNLLIDRRRRERKSRLGPALSCALDDASELPPAPDESPDESLDRARAITAVSRVVVQLPDELSDVYVARFVDGLAQRDAAARLGITRQRLRTMEHRLFERVGGAQASEPE